MKRRSRPLLLPVLLGGAFIQLAVSKPAHAQQPQTPSPLIEPATGISSANCPSEDSSGTAIDPDLYCIDLLSTPDLDATGSARLTPAPSPFTVSVGADGHQLYDVTIVATDLPDVHTLGPYTHYVAWSATTTLSAMQRLGDVKNGETRAGRTSFNKFFVFVTAEPDGITESRRGRMVLRGMSASTRLGAHSIQMLPSALGDTTSAVHRMHMGGPWPMPPMDPRVSNAMPGLDRLLPQATPFLPGALANVATLPAALPRRVLDLRDGDTLALKAGLVRRTINGRTYAMYAYNNQVPGPLLRVQQDATIIVNFTNAIELPSAIHWHGIRLENAFDGVAHVTQDPVAPGSTFRYRVHFPDAGIYWYHAHHREDIEQDMGLYGNIFVRATGDRSSRSEEMLMLDDILISDDGRLMPYGLERATHAIMGRFGNVLLVNGQTSYDKNVQKGEIVRFYFTNASNTRTWNVSFDGAQMKLVASDAGKYEREEMIESVVVGPAERYVVDVRFAKAGAVALLNRVQAIDHVLGSFFPEVDTLGYVHVAEQRAANVDSTAFLRLAKNRVVIAQLDPLRKYLDRPADKQLELTVKPTASLPFPLIQLMRIDTMYFHPIEWSGTMAMMDWIPTTTEAIWMLREPSTGLVNNAIKWNFKRGDLVKVRITNLRHSFHGMQHPIHLHGQRFVILATNGHPNPNLVWKDTVLLPVGMTADLLVDMSNPGLWMLHCHIAEHLEAGMSMLFNVR